MSIPPSQADVNFGMVFMFSTIGFEDSNLESISLVDYGAAEHYLSSSEQVSVKEKAIKIRENTVLHRLSQPESEYERMVRFDIPLDRIQPISTGTPDFQLGFIVDYEDQLADLIPIEKNGVPTNDIEERSAASTKLQLATIQDIFLKHVFLTPEGTIIRDIHREKVDSLESVPSPLEPLDYFFDGEMKITSLDIRNRLLPPIRGS